MSIIWNCTSRTLLLVQNCYWYKKQRWWWVFNHNLLAKVAQQRRPKLKLCFPQCWPYLSRFIASTTGWLANMKYIQLQAKFFFTLHRFSSSLFSKYSLNNSDVRFELHNSLEEKSKHRNQDILTQNEINLFSITFDEKTCKT